MQSCKIYQNIEFWRKLVQVKSKKVTFTHNIQQKIFEKLNQFCTVAQGQKSLVFDLRNHWPLLPKVHFWKGGCTIECVLTKFSNISNIFLLPKKLSCMSFGSLWGISYTHFFILDIMFCFTGELYKVPKIFVPDYSYSNSWITFIW